ncbi:MAG: MerR family transcriptional regulator [Nocardioides sp.]|nr:MerR family transcriptional regulator [Nocardioides sp.]
MRDPVDSNEELLTLDELCERVDMSVRNVRFYTTRGLVPSPIKRGRSGYYSSEHVARLELVTELQQHGFTLAAIERYVARIPEDATPAAIALHRALLAPWMSEMGETMTRSALDQRAGRKLTDADLATLETLSVITPVGPRDYDVTLAHLDAALKLIEFGWPTDAAAESMALYEEHATAIAEGITGIFREKVWPAYRASGATDEDLLEAVEVLMPMSIAGLVSAYGKAMNEAKRRAVARRAQ